MLSATLPNDPALPASVMSPGYGEFHFWTEPALRYHARGSIDMWRAPENDLSEDDCQSSPLLPHDHPYSIPLRSSRQQAIEQGRREIMEMVRDMPESCFELSLKDIVDEGLSLREARKEDGSIDKEEMQKSRKKRKKAKNVPRLGMDRSPVSRSYSMDSGSFMIKMFFPAFLKSRTAQSKGGNRSKSKVSPRTSIDGTENHQACVAADERIQSKHSSSKTSNSSSSSINSSRRSR